MIQVVARQESHNAGAMNHCWPSVATWAVGLPCAAVELYWGGQDRQGAFHPDYLWADDNIGISLFLLGPHLLLALSALIAWRKRAAFVGFVLTVVLCGIGILAGWIDHDQYMHTPPGRETPQILSFLAAIVMWVGSVGVLAAGGKSRLATARSSG